MCQFYEYSAEWACAYSAFCRPYNLIGRGLSISNEQDAQAAAVKRDTNTFLFLAGALLAGTSFFFTQLSERVDALDKQNISQNLALADANKEIQFLKAEIVKINTGFQVLQGKHDTLKDRVLVLEQKKQVIQHTENRLKAVFLCLIITNVY